MTTEGEHLWSPAPARIEASNMRGFMRWLAQERAVYAANYDALWRWSVADLESFWAAIWDFADIQHDGAYAQVLDTRRMPGGKWFDGAAVNYAEHMLRHEAKLGATTALHYAAENRPLAAVDWATLGGQVRILATRLRAMGVQPGDRIVSVMPNAPETAIAMLATTAIGAVWSSAAPEFGVRTVIDRFAQIEPKILFAADGYRFAGKDFDREPEIRAIAAALPKLHHIVWLSYLHPAGAVPDIGGIVSWAAMLSGPPVPAENFRYTRVGCQHPLWIVFSSGTTGLPKAIVHSHVGVLLEHLKLNLLHFDFGPASVMFFYTTTGWMMWNLLLSALLAGAAAVLYDGSPTYPSPAVLWQLASDTGVTSFGTSPSFIQLVQKAGIVPARDFDLSALQWVMVAGAPSTPEIFAWFYENVKRDLWVTSQSGGTEICSAFVGASPLLPVYAGEIQTRLLGMDVQSWDDDGQPVIDSVGELVVTAPFPSMPIMFWNDADGARYRDAYFAVFPGVWRHGDFIKINKRGGCYIYGRSDSTLNRHGVRIGTAEIYRTLEQLAEVADSLIVCCERPGGQFFMPLFIALAPDATLNGPLRALIAARLRAECSPRHVPDCIVAVPAIPYTLTGKKMEIPVRKLLMGTPLERACSRDAMANPSAIDFFTTFEPPSP